MPEHRRSGQSDPVRGDALPTQSEAAGVVVGHDMPPASRPSTRSTAASALAITQSRNQHAAHHTQRRADRSAATAIRLVPVSSTSHTINNADQLPPSPPSTPSQSPPAQSHLSESWSNEELQWSTSNREQELRNALASLTIREGSLPDTPDASPSTVSSSDGKVTQQLAVSACDFVKNVLPNIVPIGIKSKNDMHTLQRRGHYIIEDAGLELMHHSSIGAVLIYTGPSTVVFTTTATSPTDVPRTRRNSSLRLSGSSSPNLERVIPRRTLITRIGCGDASDDHGLRTHILDVLDHATEKLHVDNVIFALDRTGMDDERFRATVHGLCYVGASIIGHGALDNDTHEERLQHKHALPVEGGDVEENILAPRCVGRNLVLLSVDV